MIRDLRQNIKDALFNIGTRGFLGVSDQMEQSRQRTLKRLYRNLRNLKTDAHQQNQGLIDNLQIHFPVEITFYSSDNKEEERMRAQNIGEFQEILKEGPSQEMIRAGYKIDILKIE